MPPSLAAAIPVRPTGAPGARLPTAAQRATVRASDFNGPRHDEARQENARPRKFGRRADGDWAMIGDMFRHAFLAAPSAVADAPKAALVAATAAASAPAGVATVTAAAIAATAAAAAAVAAPAVVAAAAATAAAPLDGARS
ncbi:hypothetical protein STSP_10950 [Streptomyces jeddahensis]|uniref:Uncharacterized protein n=1 Tax=Streptomyces jeddahensis TaxID=1716141 RepID=A0A177HX71_9ACTN|nr:hypothetical protein STSP_10950 [Streptomyces jeddahensis]